MTSARGAGLRLDQCRPHLRAAQADARRASPGRCRRSASCARTASRCTPTRTCRSASSRSAASPTPTCRAPPQRIAMLGDAIAGFLARDYCYIGMDHFALPDDSLAVAKREGRLHRNFQGYSTQPDCDLVGARRLRHRPGRRRLLPEREDAAGVLRVAAASAACPSSGLRPDPRRRAAARRHHGADVPGPARVRSPSSGRTA